MLNAGQWPVLVTEAVLGSMIGPGVISKDAENCSLFQITQCRDCNWRATILSRPGPSALLEFMSELIKFPEVRSFRTEPRRCSFVVDCPYFHNSAV